MQNCSLPVNGIPFCSDPISLSGTLREGRFKSCLIHSDIYLLACLHYEFLF